MKKSEIEKLIKESEKIGPPKGNIYWKDILHQIYIWLPNAYGPGKMSWDDEHPIAKKLKISGYDLMIAVNFLIECDLVELRKEGDYNFMYLTKKGFDVAFQNEKLREEVKTQRRLLGFTGVIAVSSVFTFITTLKIYQAEAYQYILLWAFTILLLFILMILKPPFFIKRK